VAGMSDKTPQIHVHIIEDYVHLPPCGVGEVGVPPYAPALANAVFAATGQLFRDLPFKGAVKAAAGKAA